MFRKFLFVPILLGGVGVTALLIALGPEPAGEPLRETLPSVHVREVRLGTHPVLVTGEGVVTPARRTMVPAEVAGRVTWAADGLRPGTRVEAGAPLFRIDPLNYEQAAAEAGSRLAEARLRAATEEAAAGIARADWEEAGEEPDPLALREPQLAAARAAVAAAEAALRRAERDLDRAEVVAPHAGLVAERRVEVGETTAPGAPLIALLPLEVAEIVVSLPDAALALVDLPFPGAGAAARPAVEVTPVLGPEASGPGWSWSGRLTRMGAELDPVTRMFPGVVEVRNPYRPGPNGRPPLVAGMLVRAAIGGRPSPGTARVPRNAFREDGTVLIVDGDDRIRVREVDAFWRDPSGAALVRAGLAEGDRLVLEPPGIVVPGARVRPIPATAREEPESPR